MADSNGDWNLIESDPGVFTQLIKKFGAKGVQVEEIYSMEDSMFDNLRPVHGLIFLFKYRQNEPTTGQVIKDPELFQNVYFAKQVISNACATQAVISLLMNCDHRDLDLGPELTKLKEFSRSFDPRMRGLALGNSETIREAHNSVTLQYHIELDYHAPTEDEAAYHYVSYIPIDGRIYELDGLREGPIDHGPIGPENDWLDVIRPIITRRIEFYTEGEIHFNLMAVVSDRKALYERKLEELLTNPQMGYSMETDELDNEVTRLRILIEYEESKMAKYEVETARRRHNYLPFIIKILQILAEEKKLSPLLDKSKDRATRRGAKRLKT